MDAPDQCVGAGADTDMSVADHHASASCAVEEPWQSRTLLICAEYVPLELAKQIMSKAEYTKQSAVSDVFGAIVRALEAHFGSKLKWAMASFHHKPGHTAENGQWLADNNHIHITTYCNNSITRAPVERMFYPLLHTALLNVRGSNIGGGQMKVKCKLFMPRANPQAELKFNTGADFHINYVNNPEHQNHAISEHKIVQLGEHQPQARPKHGGDTCQTAMHISHRFLAGFLGGNPPTLIMVLAELANMHPKALLMNTTRQLKSAYEIAHNVVFGVHPGKGATHKWAASNRSYAWIGDACTGNWEVKVTRQGINRGRVLYAPSVLDGYKMAAKQLSDKAAAKDILFSIEALKKASTPEEDEALKERWYWTWYDNLARAHILEEGGVHMGRSAKFPRSSFNLNPPQDKWLTSLSRWEAEINDADKGLAAAYNTTQKRHDQYIRAHLLLFGEVPTIDKKEYGAGAHKASKRKRRSKRKTRVL